MTYKSLLFIPGNNPGMLQNSDILGADAVIIDLEDAVAPTEKDSTRILVREYLKEYKERDTKVFIRINPIGTPFYEEDLESIIDLNIEGVVLPVASVESLRKLDKDLDKYKKDFKIIALVETAVGLESSFEIVKESDRLIGLFLGAEDMTLNLGAKRTKESREIEYARAKLIAAGKSKSLQVIDTPFTDVNDFEGLEVDTYHGKDMGMTGKALINPRQVDLVNKIYTPSEEEVAYALRIVAALEENARKGIGVFALEGKMVDAPIIHRAFNVLKLSGDYKEEYDELL